MPESNSALERESKPPPSEGPKSGESPAANEPVDEASHNDGEVDAPVEEGSRDWGAERLSAVEADALAESFRPAWETDWGADGAPPAGDTNLDGAAAQIASAPEARSFDAPKAPLTAQAEPAIAAPVAAPIPPEPMPTATSPLGEDTAAVPVVLPGASQAKRNLMLGAGAFLVALIVIMGFMLSGKDEPTQALTAAAPAGVTDPALSQAAAERAEEVAGEEPAETVEEAAPEAPVTYQLSVRTEPSNATLTLDGESVSNPLTRAIEADDAEHRLVASADGFLEASTTVRFDADHEEVLRLEAEPPPEPVAMVEPPPTRMQATRRRSTRRTTAAMSRRRRATMRSTMRSRGAGFTTSNPY